MLIKFFSKQDCGRTSPAIESIAENTLRYQIFDAGGHMIRSEHMKSCLAAQIRFMLFKGPGFFKIFFQICGNLEYLKAYRLIPLTPPFRFHFTLPLSP